VRFGSSAQRYRRINPTPSGEPFDPFVPENRLKIPQPVRV